MTGWNAGYVSTYQEIPLIVTAVLQEVTLFVKIALIDGKKKKLKIGMFSVPLVKKNEFQPKIFFGRSR